MNTTKNALKTSDELFEMLTVAKSDMARTLLAHAVNATRTYETVHGQLAEHLDYIRREIDRAVGHLNAGEHVNQLGILQSNGVETDRLCGEMARTLDAAKAAQGLLKELGIN